MWYHPRNGNLQFTAPINASKLQTRGKPLPLEAMASELRDSLQLKRPVVMLERVSLSPCQSPMRTLHSGHKPLEESNGSRINSNDSGSPCGPPSHSSGYSEQTLKSSPTIVRKMLDIVRGSIIEDLGVSKVPVVVMEQLEASLTPKRRRESFLMTKASMFSSPEKTCNKNSEESLHVTDSSRFMMSHAKWRQEDSETSSIIEDLGASKVSVVVTERLEESPTPRRRRKSFLKAEASMSSFLDEACYSNSEESLHVTDSSHLMTLRRKRRRGESETSSIIENLGASKVPVVVTERLEESPTPRRRRKSFLKAEASMSSFLDETCYSNSEESLHVTDSSRLTTLRRERRRGDSEKSSIIEDLVTSKVPVVVTERLEESPSLERRRKSFLKAEASMSTSIEETCNSDSEESLHVTDSSRLTTLRRERRRSESETSSIIEDLVTSKVPVVITERLEESPRLERRRKSFLKAEASMSTSIEETCNSDSEESLHVTDSSRLTTLRRERRRGESETSSIIEDLGSSKVPVVLMVRLEESPTPRRQHESFLKAKASMSTSIEETCNSDSEESLHVTNSSRLTTLRRERRRGESETSSIIKELGASKVPVVVTERLKESPTPRRRRESFLKAEASMSASLEETCNSDSEESFHVTDNSRLTTLRRKRREGEFETSRTSLDLRWRNRRTEDVSCKVVRFSMFRVSTKREMESRRGLQARPGLRRTIEDRITPRS